MKNGSSERRLARMIKAFQKQVAQAKTNQTQQAIRKLTKLQEQQKTSTDAYNHTQALIEQLKSCNPKQLACTWILDMFQDDADVLQVLSPILQGVGKSEASSSQDTVNACANIQGSKLYCQAVKSLKDQVALIFQKVPVTASNQDDKLAGKLQIDLALDEGNVPSPLLPARKVVVYTSEDDDPLAQERCKEQAAIYKSLLSLPCTVEAHEEQSTDDSCDAIDWSSSESEAANDIYDSDGEELPPHLQNAKRSQRPSSASPSKCQTSNGIGKKEKRKKNRAGQRARKRRFLEENKPESLKPSTFNPKRNIEKNLDREKNKPAATHPSWQAKIAQREKLEKLKRSAKPQKIVFGDNSD